MSMKLKESLSAAIDGEADEFELRRVFDEMNREPGLRTMWQRFHAIGALMRGEARGKPLSSEVALRRMWAAIDGTEEDGTNRNPGRPRIPGREPWSARMIGAGVAAAVAVAVLIGFGGTWNETDIDAPAIAFDGTPVIGVPATPAADSTSPASLERLVTANAAAIASTNDEPRLRPFPSEADLLDARAKVLQHVHTTALNRAASPVPFVKVAAFESR